MSIHRTVAINDIFTFDGVTYHVAKTPDNADSCLLCAFGKTICPPSMVFECRAKNRSDHVYTYCVSSKEVERAAYKQAFEIIAHSIETENSIFNSWTVEIARHMDNAISDAGYAFIDSRKILTKGAQEFLRFIIEKSKETM